MRNTTIDVGLYQLFFLLLFHTLSFRICFTSSPSNRSLCFYSTQLFIPFGCDTKSAGVKKAAIKCVRWTPAREAPIVIVRNTPATCLRPGRVRRLWRDVDAYFNSLRSKQTSETKTTMENAARNGVIRTRKRTLRAWV